MHSSSSLGHCQSGAVDHQGSWVLAAQARIEEIAQAPADARIIAVSAWEIEKQKNGRLDPGAGF